MSLCRVVPVFIVAAALPGAARLQLKADGVVAADSTAAIQVAPPRGAHHRLTICNAYASASPLSVARLPADLLTAAPLAYKRCEEVRSPVVQGDELVFKVGDRDVGSFLADGMPTQSASLLLVLYRRREGVKSSAFDSHVFVEDAGHAQVAVIDAYRGPMSAPLAASGPVKIERRLPEDKASKDHAKAALVQRGEALAFGSVAFVNPGEYSVRLGHGTPKIDLAAEQGRSYVVMRVGTGRNGTAFPEELVLFSGAGAGQGLVGLVLAALVRVACGH